MAGDLKVGIKIQADADAAKDALRDTAEAIDDIGQKADPAKDSIDDLGRGIERAGAEARTAGGAMGRLVDELAPSASWPWASTRWPSSWAASAGRPPSF